MTGVSRIRRGYALDDVLLVPQRSAVRSRGDVDTGVTLAPGIRLGHPLVSANTQWCTGARLAEATAACGGLGFVHRMQTVDQQAAQVAAVKAATPPDGGTGRTAPALGADGRLLVGAAVGVTGDYWKRAARLVECGADLLLVDVAHGHTDHTLEAVERLRGEFPDVVLVAGNVATASGTRDLANAGAHVVKVGIGPGGVCTTRLVAGSGVPQLTAVLDCAEEARRQGVTVIADGGIRQGGDVAKAVAAGATAVMAGSALAGSDESEALLVERDGRRHKASRGFATLGMATSLRLAEGASAVREEVEEYVPEGVEATFSCTGPVAGTVHELVGGLRSGMSYSGARTIEEFHGKAEFVEVSPTGQAENRPHVLGRAPERAPDYRGEVLGT